MKIFCLLNFENLFLPFILNIMAVNLNAFMRLKDLYSEKNSKYACERIKSLTSYLKCMAVKGHLGGVLGTMFGGIMLIF